MAESVVRRLGGSLALAVAGLLVLGVTVEVAGSWLAERERAFDRARRDLSEAARRYRSASDDRAVYRQYATRFRDMRAHGWIGEERRLTWIEALRRVNGNLKLPTLRYEIGQRVPARLDGTPGGGRLQLFRTPMQLEIGALHEYDVVELLQRLEGQGAGLLALSGCRLERGGELRLDPRATNVRASCALDWYTLELEAADG